MLNCQKKIILNKVEIRTFQLKVSLFYVKIKFWFNFIFKLEHSTLLVNIVSIHSFRDIRYIKVTG